jgi:rubrerythrin
MPDLFSAAEMLNIAVREEVTGATFYRALADKTRSEELKQFALQTADMEDKHAERFRKLLAKVGHYKPAAESYEGEYAEYLAYLVEGRIFPVGADAQQMAAKMKNDREAVETAAEMEKNTLVLYQELMRFVPKKDQAVLQEIMDEERIHLLQFTKFKENNF